jgi:hypothetical protein
MHNLNADPKLGMHQRHAIDPKTIPGWGVDLNPLNRPGVPRETDPGDTGAHWDEPEQQKTDVRIFFSTERPMVTPVFGTTCPPKLLSGVIRTKAYQLGEDKKRRWLMLLAADRVDVVEERLKEFLLGRVNEEGKRTPNPLNWLLLAGAVVGSTVLIRSARNGSLKRSAKSAGSKVKRSVRSMKDSIDLSPLSGSLN